MLAEELQQVTGSNIELAYVDQNYTGSNTAQSGNSTHRAQRSQTLIARRGLLLPGR